MILLFKKKVFLFSITCNCPWHHCGNFKIDCKGFYHFIRDKYTLFYIPQLAAVVHKIKNYCKYPSIKKWFSFVGHKLLIGKSHDLIVPHKNGMHVDGVCFIKANVFLPTGLKWQYTTCVKLSFYAFIRTIKWSFDTSNMHAYSPLTQANVLVGVRSAVGKKKKKLWEG